MSLAARRAPTPEDDNRRMGFVLALRQAGALDARVLAALERLDRAAFAPPAFRALAAYGDVALPLADCQSMTRPSLVARVVEAAALTPMSRVLEIGAGSGYQTAALAALAGRVTSMERVGALAEAAGARLIGAAEVLHADGLAGAPGAASYDVVIVNAALQEPPRALMRLLAEGGALIAPFGEPQGQRLVRVRALPGERYAVEDLGPSRFAPIGRGLA